MNWCGLENKVIVDAYQQNASDIHIEPRPGKEKTVIRFRKDGSLVNYIEVPASLPQRADHPPQDHVRPRHFRAAPAAGRQDQVQEVRPDRHRTARGDHPTAGGVEDVVMRILAAGEPIPGETWGFRRTTTTAS